MGFRRENTFGTKTKRDRQREDLHIKIGSLTASVISQEKHILSRKTIRDSDYREIVRLKNELEDTDRELQILKRKLAKMEDLGK